MELIDQHTKGIMEGCKDRARDSGLQVDVRVPTYDTATWKGYVLGNRQVYPGWATPESHPAVVAARDCYLQAVTPMVENGVLGRSAAKRHAAADQHARSR